MHILVVTHYFWPEDFRINDLVKDWLARGHRVTVLTGTPNYPSGDIFESYRSQPEKFMNFFGARVIRLPILPRGKTSARLLGNYLSFIFFAVTLGPLRLRNVKPDVIFVFEPSPITVGLPALLLSKLKKCPVVLWVLDLWPETLTAVGAVKSGISLRLVGSLVQFIYNGCTVILGQSRKFVPSIRKYCRDDVDVQYFPSWAEEVLNHGFPEPSTLIPQLADGFTVMFAGNIGEAQDFSAVLNAAEQLNHDNSIRWIIVGDGRKANWLKAQLVRRGLQEKVLLLGRHPVEKMPSIYAHADALLVSLKRDPVFSLTIPAKVQSYLMAGLPILGMLDGEGREVIQEANAGLTCDAGDSDGLARAVLSLMAMSPDERRKLGENARRYAKREFDRGRLVEKLDNILANAIAECTKK